MSFEAAAATALVGQTLADGMTLDSNVTADAGSSYATVFGLYGILDNASDIARVVLNDVSISTSAQVTHSEVHNYGVFIMQGKFDLISTGGDITVSTTGDNASANSESAGVYNETDSVLKLGNGKISVTGPGRGFQTMNAYGIYSSGGSVTHNGIIEVTVAGLNESKSKGHATAVYVAGPSVITLGTESITATATGGAKGIYVSSSGGTVYLKSGSIAATADVDDAYGVHACGGIVTLGTATDLISISAESQEEHSYGLYADGGEISLTNGSVTAAASSLSSYGVWVAEESTVTLGNVNINATSTSGETAAGIESEGTFSLSGGNITVRNATYEAVGVSVSAGSAQLGDNGSNVAIDVESAEHNAYGISAEGGSVSHTGSITVTTKGERNAYGVYTSDSAQVVLGDEEIKVTAMGEGGAYGLTIGDTSGKSKMVGGSIAVKATSEEDATGVYIKEVASFSLGSSGPVNITATAANGGAYAIENLGSLTYSGGTLIAQNDADEDATAIWNEGSLTITGNTQAIGKDRGVDNRKSGIIELSAGVSLIATSTMQCGNVIVAEGARFETGAFAESSSEIEDPSKGVYTVTGGTVVLGSSTAAAGEYAVGNLKGKNAEFIFNNASGIVYSVTSLFGVGEIPDVGNGNTITVTAAEAGAVKIAVIDEPNLYNLTVSAQESAWTAYASTDEASLLGFASRLASSVIDERRNNAWAASVAKTTATDTMPGFEVSIENSAVSAVKSITFAPAEETTLSIGALPASAGDWTLTRVKATNISAAAGVDTVSVNSINADRSSVAFSMPVLLGTVSAENSAFSFASSANIDSLTSKDSTYSFDTSKKATIGTLSGSANTFVISAPAEGAITVTDATGSTGLTVTDVKLEADVVGQYETAEALAEAMAKSVLNADANTVATAVEVVDADVYGTYKAAVAADGTVTIVADESEESTKLNAAGSIAVLPVFGIQHEMNDLTRRMGDLRDAPEGVGAWVRGYGSRLEYGKQGVRSKNRSVQVGADTDAGNGWKVGGAFSYTSSDMSYAQGSGDADTYGLAAYASWFGESGLYADIIAKYHRVESEFNVEGAKGDYGVNGGSLSAEFGWNYGFAGGAFVEPQAEVRYGRIAGTKYGLSNGVSIDQKAYNSLVGRIGFRTGFHFPQNKGSVYAMASILHEFEGKMKSRATVGAASSSRREDVGGTYYEIGIGAHFNWTPRTYSYMELERNAHSAVKEDWRWNLGMRYTF